MILSLVVLEIFNYEKFLELFALNALRQRNVVLVSRLILLNNFSLFGVRRDVRTMGFVVFVYERVNETLKSI